VLGRAPWSTSYSVRSCSNSCSNSSDRGGRNRLKSSENVWRSHRNQLKTHEIGLDGRDRRDFGTVRPRVQIPGPRPRIVFRIDALPAPPTPPRHRGGHRFSRNSAAAAPVQVDCGRRLNSLTAIAQPIYQHAHGPRTVGTRVQNSKGLHETQGNSCQALRLHGGVSRLSNATNPAPRHDC
jgi:hypothetical protein